jgi:hypothetical protein
MTKNKCALTMLAAALMLTPLVRAQSSWSTVGSTCQPGSDSIGRFTYGTGGTTFQFAPGETGTIRARCQVNNPLDKGNPVWKTLGAGYVDPDAEGGDSQVLVKLLECDKKTGETVTIALFNSNTRKIGIPTFQTASIHNALDFTRAAYVVTIEVTRSDDVFNPGVFYASLN